jgi:hypothetical protein
MDRTTSFTDSWPRQPSPVGFGDRVPAGPQWAAIAALWLLAAWTRDGTPGWRGEVGAATGAEWTGQPWGTAPSPAEVARIGGLAEPPVGVEVLVAQVQEAPGKPYEPTRPAAEVVRDVDTLLRERIPVADARSERLLAHLAGLLAARWVDLLRVDTGNGELHLLRRDFSSTVVRYTVASQDTVEPPPVIAADGADAALRTRLACLMTLLSQQLWVNNNNPVTFRAWVGPRDTAEAWWARTRDEEPEEVPEFRAVTVAELHQGLHTVVRGSLLYGRGEQDEDDDDDDWDGDMPPVPPNHVTVHLYEDLLGVLLERVGAAEVLVTGHLPLAWPPEEPDDDDYSATVVFAGAEETAVLDVDLSC